MDKAEILLNELVKEAEAYEQKCQKEYAIEELEKIKAEFEDRFLLNQTVAIQIMDKYIYELKGDNNG